MQRRGFLTVVTVLLSLVPLSFFVSAIPTLLGSDLLVPMGERADYAIWITHRQLGWALLGLNLITLLILWIPFRRGDRWSLLPLWAYVLGYLLPAHFVPILSTDWFSADVGELIKDAIALPGLARLAVLNAVVPFATVVLLAVATGYLLRRNQPRRVRG